MSFHLTKAIIENSSELTDGQFRVLVGIANFLNANTGRCNPGIALIANRVGMQERSVRRIIRQLEELGRISVRAGGKGPGSSNQYNFPDSKKPDSGVTHNTDPSVRVADAKRVTEETKKEDSSGLITEKGTNNNKEQITQLGLRKGKEIFI